MGLGLIHYIPPIIYAGFWLMCIVALAGRPLWALYYVIPLLPYRSMRDHFIPYPLGTNLLTILILAVIAGALIHGKRLPRSKLYLLWMITGVYLYASMWMGTALGNCPAPLWLSDLNFVMWKDYILVPLAFVAASLVIEDRKAIRAVIIVSAVSLLLIDRTCILENLQRTWTTFDEGKRDLGPLALGPNATAAYLTVSAIFFWGVLLFVKAKKYKLLGYGMIALTVFAAMYTFSRGGYAALLIGILILGILKDRKLLLVLGVFLLTWQLVVPNAVRERVLMTKDSNGQLEASAQERVSLWKESWDSFVHRPIAGNGFATFQYGQHVVESLKDTHNYYVKVMVETGIIGLALTIFLIQQMLALALRLFRRATDPLLKGLGLGLFAAVCACLVANCFGDRWSYIEISGPLWVLIACGARGLQLIPRAVASDPIPTAAATALLQ